MKQAFKLMLVALVLCATAHAQPPGAAPDPIAAILGSPANTWRFISAAPQPAVVKGVPVLTSGAGYPNFVGTKDYGPNVEYTVVCHFRPEAAGNCGLQFQIATKGEDQQQPNDIGAALILTPDHSYLPWYVYNAPGQKGYKSTGVYYLKGITQRNLSWPETVRKTIEAESAAQPGMEDRWFTLRLVVRPGLVRMYLDDRFMDQRDEPGLNVTGKMHFYLYPNTDIASLTVKPLPPEDPRYMPAAIGGYANAGAINNEKLAAGALPSPGIVKQIGGIPFVFPGTNLQGDDHISLAKSWAPFTGMEGSFESLGGDFGGRWPSPFNADPERIQLRLPYDSYNNLHLIAASDDSPNSVPVVTAQFYEELAGYPQNFAGRVPSFTAHASHVTTLPVKLANGRTGSLYLVTIPLDPAKLATVHYTDSIAVELTKEVKLYRSYPDPSDFSFHQGGLPSNVQIYAITLERAPVTVDFKPDKFAHVWTAPTTPSYTASLVNRTDAPRTVSLELVTESHDGTSKIEQRQDVTVPGGGQPTEAHFKIDGLKEFGYHTVTLRMRDGDRVWQDNLSLAYLHPDTRQHGGWAMGKGPAMGYWGWGGAHGTPDQLHEMEVMAEAGAETALGSFEGPDTPQDVKDFARAHHMFTSSAFSPQAPYVLGFSAASTSKLYDPAHPEATGEAMLAQLRKEESGKSDINDPVEVPFFPEPGLGPITYGNLPIYWGEPEHKLTPDEQKNYDYYLPRFLISAAAVRKAYPNVKILFPYGDPLFNVPFLRMSPEARKYIDGIGLDIAFFERTPESQLTQLTQHRLYEMRSEWKKIGKDPYLAMYEGPCVDTPPGALTWEQQSDYYTRLYMLFFAYGVYLHHSGPTPFDCSNYWGEQHYGCCGLFARLPMANPKPAYVAYATMTRHLNRANFTKWIPTGSLTAYCLQFKNVNDGHLIYSLYVVRGKRTASLTVGAGDHVTYYNEDDNPVELPVRDGKVTVTLTESPAYLEGLTIDPTVVLGAPDNSDSQPAAIRTKLANLGDGSWKISTARDLQYENNDVLQIARFEGNFSAAPVTAPAAAGSHALAVHLGKQDKLREVMPWYTTLVPAHPIVIPGKASHLGLWVQASSDWGRVVYSLKDASGQTWISIGTQDSWNCDDTKTLSYFNFDGLRYLRFELPSTEGYDHFIDAGTTWWGHHGGDGYVHLPLTLEKIIVERRTNAMYVNDPQPTQPDDVLLGDLNAEYASAYDKTPAAIRETEVQMPVPAGVPALANPITDMAASGIGAPTHITHVDPPPSEADGTRALVYFEPVTGAQSYDIWVSPYENGAGAQKLGAGWKEPGQLLTGLHADVDFYLFVVYTDAAGKLSKPSAPFKIHLKDLFAMK